jgi:hypothetical protein
LQRECRLSERTKKLRYTSIFFPLGSENGKIRINEAKKNKQTESNRKIPDKKTRIRRKE